MHRSPRLDRRDLLKKTLAVGTAGYVAPMIVGAVTTVNAQAISGAVCPAESQCSLTCGVAGLPNTCACVTSVAGPLVCVDPTCTFTTCTSNAGCPAGSVCFTDVSDCCNQGNSYCVPICTGQGGGGAATRTPWRH